MSSGTPTNYAKEETVDSLRIHVRRTLDLLRVGELYTKYGLTEFDEWRLVPDDIETGAAYEDVVPRDGSHIFQVFIHAVASEIVDGHGIKGDKKKKRAIKDYKEVLQRHRGEWIENIFIQKQKRAIGASTSIRVSKKPPEMPVASPATAPAVSAAATPAGAVDDIGSIPKKKKKKTPVSTSAAKKRKRSDADDYQQSNFDDGHHQPIELTPKKRSTKKRKRVTPLGKQLAARAAKEEFEAQRDAVLADIPSDYKAAFQQLGFGQWQKSRLPVLVVSPYAVPPGDIRDLWLKMYSNVKEKNQIEKMSFLVHWLGAGGYSLVARAKFMPYDEAVKKGITKIPKKLQEMHDSGKKLSTQQQQLLDGLLLLQDQARLKPEDRSHPSMEFFELHELKLGDEVLSDVREEEMEDDIESDDEDEDRLLDDDEEELVDDDQKPESEILTSPSLPKKKLTKKMNKKPKGAEVDLDDFAERESENEAAEPVAPRQKKAKEKRKAGRPPKRTKIDPEDISAEVEVEDPSSTRKGEQVEPAEATAEEPMEELQPVQAMTRIPKIKKGYVLEEDVPPGEEPKIPKKTKKETADEPVVTKELLDQIIGASASATDDSDDSEFGGDEYGKKYFEDELYARENFEEDLDVQPKKKGRLQKKGYKKAGKSADKEEKAAPKKRGSYERKKRSKAAEQRDLENCEGEYLPLVEKLKSATQKKNVKKILAALKAILPVAESFSAPFFRIYEIPAVMKSTKSVLAETGNKEDMTTYKTLWNTMKASYQEKEANIPEGFKAKKGRGVPKVDEAASNAEKVTPAPTKGKVEDVEAAPVGEASKADTVGAMNEYADAGKCAPPTPGNLKEPRESGTVEESPMKVPVKADKRRPSLDEEEKQLLQINKTVEKVAPPKAKPKKFSVMDLMGSKKKAPRDDTAGTGAGRASLFTQSEVGKKAIPVWLTTSPPPSKMDASADTSDRRDDRLFALEFLLQGASHLPDGKGVNVEAVARSLELAIYEWSESSTNWVNDYWAKVDAIVAAITGKRDIGTIVEMLVDGQFSTPKSVVNLSLDHLEDSFEGRPVIYQE